MSILLFFRVHSWFSCSTLLSLAELAKQTLNQQAVNRRLLHIVFRK
jgi:hypothetical protein